MNIIKLNNLNVNQLNEYDQEKKIDFKKLDTLHLKEMIERQDNLLSNKYALIKALCCFSF